jgi:hypothetical protein
MLKSIVLARLAAFEKQWKYDASYLRELADVGTSVVWRFGQVSSLGQLAGVPPAARVAAQLVGTLTEDCGPCTQLVLDMASKNGVAPEILRAIVAGEESKMDDDARLAYRFARASLARDLAATDPLRDEVVAKWGKRGLVALALALTTARMYPTLKYALGYGRACSKIEVAGASAPVAIHA